MTLVDAAVRQSFSANGTTANSLRVLVDMTGTEWTNLLAGSVPTPTNSVGTGAMTGVTNFIATPSKVG